MAAAPVLLHRGRDRNRLAACAVRLARGASAPAARQSLVLVLVIDSSLSAISNWQLASRRLQSAKNGTAVGHWVLPHRRAWRLGGVGEWGSFRLNARTSVYSRNRRAASLSWRGTAQPSGAGREGRYCSRRGNWSYCFSLGMVRSSNREGLPQRHLSKNRKHSWNRCGPPIPWSAPWMRYR